MSAAQFIQRLFTEKARPVDPRTIARLQREYRRNVRDFGKGTARLMLRMSVDVQTSGS